MPIFGERLLNEKIPLDFVVNYHGVERSLATVCLHLKDRGYTNEFIFTLSHLLFKYSQNGYAVRNEYYTEYHKGKLKKFYHTLNDVKTALDLCVEVLLAAGYSNSAMMLTKESIKRCFKCGVVPNGIFNIIPSKNGFLILKNKLAEITDVSACQTHIRVREYLCNCGNDKPINICHKFKRNSERTPIDDIVVPAFNRCPKCGIILSDINTHHNSRDRIEMIFMKDTE